MSEIDNVPIPGMEAHARMTDPVSSDLTVKSLGRDTSAKMLVFRCVYNLSAASLKFSTTRPVTDDQILALMENWTGKRQQRNVIARTRGLLREAGWLQRVDDQVNPSTGRPTIAHIPTEAGLKAWVEWRKS